MTANDLRSWSATSAAKMAPNPAGRADRRRGQRHGSLRGRGERRRTRTAGPGRRPDPAASPRRSTGAAAGSRTWASVRARTRRVSTPPSPPCGPRSPGPDRVTRAEPVPDRPGPDDPGRGRPRHRRRHGPHRVAVSDPDAVLATLVETKVTGQDRRHLRRLVAPGRRVRRRRSGRRLPRTLANRAGSSARRRTRRPVGGPNGP